MRERVPPRGGSSELDPQGRNLRVDAAILVVAQLWLLFLIPARVVLGPLGGVGQPALFVAALATFFYAFSRFSREGLIDRDPNPMRWALVVFLAYHVFNFALLQVRPLTDLETTSSARAMIVLVAVGVSALLLVDGVYERRLELVQTAVVLGAAVGAVAVYLQFFLGYDVARLPLSLPGFIATTDFNNILSRSNVSRPAGLQTHPIEMGVIMGAVLPVAIHRALYGDTQRPQVAWVAVGLIGSASILSGSRSAVISLVVSTGVLGLVWTWRQRINAAITGLVGLVMLWGISPGLISTLLFLFRNLDDDPSAQARLDRFPAVLGVWLERPLFGRGIGTFTVEEGMLLDQQFYQSVIEIGVVGLAVTLLLVGVGLAAGMRVAWVCWCEGDRAASHQALAYVGMLLALTLTMATYTAFWYRVHLTLFLLGLGMLGCLWRLRVRDVAPGFERDPLEVVE